MSWTHEEIIGRLEEIEQALADRQEAGERAATEYHREKRAYEEEYATVYMASTGTATERKQDTLLSLKSSDAYRRLVVAEGAYEGWRAAMRTLEARSMIGMALLKASTREAPVDPSWSRGDPMARRGVAA